MFLFVVLLHFQHPSPSLYHINYIHAPFLVSHHENVPGRDTKEVRKKKKRRKSIAKCKIKLN